MYNPIYNPINQSQTKIGEYGPIEWLKAFDMNQFQRSTFNSPNYQLNARVVEQLKQLKISLGTAQKGRKIKLSAIIYTCVIFISLIIYIISIAASSGSGSLYTGVYIYVVFLFLTCAGYIVFICWHVGKICQSIQMGLDSLNQRFYQENLPIVLVPQKLVPGNSIRNFRFIDLFERVNC